MKRVITRIEPLQELPKRTRVAAYTRVSSGKEAMLNSLAAQISYYKNLIVTNSEWEFAGIYADEGLTGTSESRDQFQALINDCRNGKIDMIITKSISRFARNTLILLETIRELKSLNIDVFFEEQNIHTLSSEGEMILTFMATFAQEESRSVSENMKWRIKKDFEEGIMWGGKDSLGYRIIDRKLVLVPEEAEIVKLIFDLYLQGYGDMQIAKILNEEGIEPMKSKLWNRSSIRNILINSNYTGNLILQKTYRENHLTKVTRLNRGEFDKYYIEDNHQPIISEKVFKEATMLRASKANNNEYIENDSPYKGKIRCGNCDKMYTFRRTKYNNVWLCSTARQKGASACNSKQVPDKKIMEASNNLGVNSNLVESIIVNSNNALIFRMEDGTQKDYIWEYDPKSQSWTDEMKEAARKRVLNQYRRKD